MKKDNLARLQEMMNLHRSQYQCTQTRLKEKQLNEIAQTKNQWQMTLHSLQKQHHALINQKSEQEKKATNRKVKELYEQKLSEETQQSEELMKEKFECNASSKKSCTK